MNNTLLKALKSVFVKPAYLMLAGFIGVIVFMVAVLFPNSSLIFSVLGNANASFSVKVGLIFNLLGGITTNFSLLSASYTVLIALLIGMNIAMMVFYFKKKRGFAKSSSLGSMSGGFFAGAMGIGCAACGSLFLSAFMPAIGAGAALAFLPLGGAEFGVLAVVLLFVSLITISKQIMKPNVC